jgi:hypothetical protein
MMDPPDQCHKISEFIETVKQSAAGGSSLPAWNGGEITEDVLDEILACCVLGRQRR